jgi:hypothetical protein
MSDSRELAHQATGGAVSAAEPDRFAQTIQMVREAMLNPDVNAEKAKAMADLMISLEDRAMKSEFNRALNAAIMEMPVITKDGRIIIKDKDTGRERQQGRFAKYEDIDRVVRPIAARHNLAYRFEIGESNQGITVRPIISHANGYTERGEAMRLPSDQSGGKNAVQAVGSASQYGKRYTLCAAFNIITEGIDDDGNLGQGKVSLPFEREETVKTEAKAAHEAGTYLEWYARQSPKDRAWLVFSGLHAQYGGPALPSPASPPPPSPRPATPTPTPSPPPPPASSNGNGSELGLEGGTGEPPPAKKRKTPREWVDTFKSEVGRAASLDALDTYMDTKRESLGRLKESDEALWGECDQAYKSRVADFLE